jgi:hypothetical protein
MRCILAFVLISHGPGRDFEVYTETRFKRR